MTHFGRSPHSRMALFMAASHSIIAACQQASDVVILGINRQDDIKSIPQIYWKPFLTPEDHKASDFEEILVMSKSSFATLEALPMAQQFEEIANALERAKRPIPTLTIRPVEPFNIPFFAKESQFDRSHGNQPFYAKFRKKEKRRRR